MVDIVEDVGSDAKIVTDGLFRKPGNVQRAKQDQAHGRCSKHHIHATQEALVRTCSLEPSVHVHDRVG